MSSRLVALILFAGILGFHYGRQHMGTSVRRVAKLRDRDSIIADPYYQWRSAHKVILLRVKEAMGAGSAPGGSYNFGEGFYVVELDIRTGKETPFTEFNKRFFGSGHKAIGYWRLSPDGNWLLYPGVKRPPSGGAWFVASLDGSRSMSWPQPEGEAVGAETPYYAWTPDSRRWVALVGHHEHAPKDPSPLSGKEFLESLSKSHNRLDAVIGSLDTPGSIREIKDIYAYQGYLYPGHALLGVTPDNKAIAAIWQKGQDTPVLFFSFAIDAKHPSPRDFAIRLPQGAHPRTLALSPKGDRLAWVLFFPDDNDRSKEELWVSRLDGTGMRKVGEVSYKPFFPMEDEHHPEGLDWTPDGRQISFLHKGALCTVRAD